jgi:hypothetical protein
MHHIILWKVIVHVGFCRTHSVFRRNYPLKDNHKLQAKHRDTIWTTNVNKSLQLPPLVESRKRITTSEIVLSGPKSLTFQSRSTP